MRLSYVLVGLAELALANAGNEYGGEPQTPSSSYAPSVVPVVKSSSSSKPPVFVPPSSTPEHEKSPSSLPPPKYESSTSSKYESSASPVYESSAPPKHESTSTPVYRSSSRPVYSTPSYRSSSWSSEYGECHDRTVYIHDTVTEFGTKTYYVENTTTVTVEKPKTIVVTKNGTVTQYDTETKWGTRTVLLTKNGTVTKYGTETEYDTKTKHETEHETETRYKNWNITTTRKVTETATITATVCPSITPRPSSSSICVSSCVVDMTATLLQYPSAVAEAPFYYPGAVVDVYVNGGETSHSTVSTLEQTTLPGLTWTVPQFPGVTFTYPTTYIAYTQFDYSFTRTQTVCHTKADSLTLEQPTHWPSLVYPTQSVSTPGLPPSSLVSYLNSQQTVTIQLEGQRIGEACDPGKGSTAPVNSQAPLTVTYTKATATPSTRSIIPVEQSTQTEQTVVVPTTTVTPPAPPPVVKTTVAVTSPAVVTAPPPPAPSTSTSTVAVVPPPAPPSSTSSLVIATVNAAATAGSFAKAGAFVLGAVGLGFGLL